ncbi:hypothetical protein [Mameliella alba]|nr:hypothetical protein [Mameliella alba]BBU58508.1 hypothetical protein KU6B_47730 [Mameliella alba]
MARTTARKRVQLVFPKTGATAQPFEDDVKAWLAQGWKPVADTTKKEAD